jgi:hypothetical protein
MLISIDEMGPVQRRHAHEVVGVGVPSGHRVGVDDDVLVRCWHVRPITPGDG